MWGVKCDWLSLYLFWPARLKKKMKQTKELLIKQKASNKTIILKLQSNKKNKKFEAIAGGGGRRKHMSKIKNRGNKINSYWYCIDVDQEQPKCHNQKWEDAEGIFFSYLGGGGSSGFINKSNFTYSVDSMTVVNSLKGTKCIWMVAVGGIGCEMVSTITFWLGSQTKQNQIFAKQVIYFYSFFFFFLNFCHIPFFFLLFLNNLFKMW